MTVAGLLLLEDDEALGEILSEVLSDQWDVTWVVDLASAYECVRDELYDVMVLDRQLPDGDATELIGWMRARADATPVLMLTALGQLDDKVSGLESGANDYLTKPFEFAELTARLHALTRNYSTMGVEMEIGSWVFHPERHSVTSPYTGRIPLSAKESELLELLARNPEKAFSRAQILQAVFSGGEQEGTVDTYVHYLRRKTEHDLIQTVRGVGYILGTPA